MTRSELMSLLDKRLSVLNEAEREDIKQDYAQHIEMKMGEGLTEEEAVGTLGDIEAIIDETLMAYNIDPNYDKSAHPDIGQKIRQALNSEFAQKTGETLNKGLDVVHNAVTSNAPKDILKAVIKIFIFCVAAFALFVFGFMVFTAISNILREILPGAFMLDKIVSGAVMLLYVVLFTAGICTVAYSYIVRSAEYLKKEKNKMNEFTAVVPADGIASEGTENVSGGPEAKATVQTEKSVGTAAKIFDIFLFIIKICVFFAVLPLFCGVIGMALALGLFLTALFMGYPTLGLTLMCLGITICMVTFLMFVFKLIFGEGGNKNEA
ncbi:MAG: hypothetical protein IJR59_05020 [Firmicutes bacterium]|nr:hypothetical protein [Bacillota bacterium]